jgi:crotonobetainyl-CoA:carnitine CoA-transferase CaiB-like acyl-CoA transferase
VTDDQPGTGPLAGLRVVEFAQVIAGPLAGTLLADLGAQVVHVEPPGTGDEARRMGPTKGGHGLWWKVLARNKRSVTLDLHREEARPLVEGLLHWADVVIVTFRAGTAERFALDWDSICRVNPSAILLQITGYGATSSRKDEPGFGKMGEARSGVVHLTGFPDGPPVHTGFSHADSLTGLMGAFAVMAALHRRSQDSNHLGEWIDLALSDTLFRLIEWQAIIYDQLGIVPNRAGNRLAVAPGAVINTYQSADDEWITVTSATAKSVANIATMLDLPEGEYSTAEQQEDRRDELDTTLATWIAGMRTEDALKAMIDADVVAAQVFDIADIFNDDVYRERESIISIDDDDLGPVRMQDVVPRLHRNRGRVWRTGASLGVDTDHVFKDWLGISSDVINELRGKGVV